MFSQIRRTISWVGLHPSTRFGVVGFVAYTYAIRFRGLLPTSVDWLFRADDGDVSALDSTANYLGWEFYRRSAMWVWPIGKTTLLGPELGSSIGLTDSLPLLGVPLKFLTWWIDRPFQYFGLWIFLCFILQAVFAGRLLQKLGIPMFVLLPSILLFTLLPTFVSRIGIHTPLSSHWVLLVAINLSLSKTPTPGKWSLLSACAMAIQPYLGVMALLICHCSVFGSWIASRKFSIRGLRTALAATLSSGFTAFQVGLFAFGGTALSTGGVGDFSANVMSIVDPISDSPFAYTPSWSRYSLLPDVIDGPYQYEGFGFVGSGVLLLAVAAVLGWTAWTLRRIVAIGSVTLVVAVIGRMADVPMSSAILFGIVGIVVVVYVRSVLSSGVQRISASLLIVATSLIAVSNKVTLGSFSLELPLPPLLLEMLGVIRVTGRFVWIVTMIVVVASVAVSVRYVSSRSVLLTVVLVSLIVQLIDTSYGVARQGVILENRQSMSGLKSTLWDYIGEQYRSIAFVLPSPTPQLRNPSPLEFQLTPNEDFWFGEGVLWAELGEFAAHRGIHLNAFYFGRDPLAGYEREAIKLTKLVRTNSYADSTLYVFVDSELWNIAKSQRRRNDVVGLLDGIPIVAPNLNSCTQCSLADVQAVQTATSE